MSEKRMFARLVARRYLLQNDAGNINFRISVETYSFLRTEPILAFQEGVNYVVLSVAA
jgi:hypothetical protein